MSAGGRAEGFPARPGGLGMKRVRVLARLGVLSLAAALLSY
jgi:hypothetical protein